MQNTAALHPRYKSLSVLGGVLFVVMFSLVSFCIVQIPGLARLGINPLLIAIILGIFYSNTLRDILPIPHHWGAGIQFSAKKILRLAIILYGFRISFQQIALIGMPGLFLDIFVVASTLIVGGILGKKFFKLDSQLSLLISAGAAICGAAAVLAVEDVLKSEPYKTSVAIGTVVLLGTLSMFLYPLLQHAGILGLNESQYGLFIGGSVHEVAQVVVAGNDFSPQAGNIAVIVKMTRVLLLIPTLLLLSWAANRNQPHADKKFALVIPWFAIGFAAMIAVNSLNIIPAAVVNGINHLDLFLLTMAMAAIGLETHLAKIKKVGLKPLYLAAALMLWLGSTVWIGVKAIF